MKAHVQNATYHVKHVLVLGGISVRRVHLTGDWQPGSAGQSVLRTFSRGNRVAADATTTARTATALDRSVVCRARLTFLLKVAFVWSALVPSTTSLGREPVDHVTTRVDPVQGLGQLVVLIALILFG